MWNRTKAMQSMISRRPLSCLALVMLLWFVFPASLPAPTWLHESEKESTEILQPPLAPLEIEESEQVRDKREQSIKTAEERLSRREEILEARTRYAAEIEEKTLKGKPISERAAKELEKSAPASSDWLALALIAAMIVSLAGLFYRKVLRPAVPVPAHTVNSRRKKRLRSRMVSRKVNAPQARKNLKRTGRF